MRVSCDTYYTNVSLMLNYKINVRYVTINTRYLPHTCVRSHNLLCEKNHILLLWLLLICCDGQCSCLNTSAAQSQSITQPTLLLHTTTELLATTALCQYLLSFVPLAQMDGRCPLTNILHATLGRFVRHDE